ncbi:hypothetical protein ACB092_11G210100 [Castanea dentata]
MGTLIDQLFARKTTFVTWRVTFSFLNERIGVSVTIKCLIPSLLHIWIFPKNTFGMCRISAIYTVVEPMVWVSFFFTNITIIFTRVIFSCITESEGMLMLFVPCSLW